MSLVGLSDKIIKQLLRIPKQLRIAIGERLVVVSNCFEKFSLFGSNLHFL